MFPPIVPALLNLERATWVLRGLKTGKSKRPGNSADAKRIQKGLGAFRAGEPGKHSEKGISENLQCPQKKASVQSMIWDISFRSKRETGRRRKRERSTKQQGRGAKPPQIHCISLLFYIHEIWLGRMAHTLNPSSWEAESGRSFFPWVWFKTAWSTKWVP